MQNLIRELRAAAGLSQGRLATEMGVSRQTINAIESNKYIPSTVLALKIARVFQKQVGEIFMLEEGD